MEADFPSNSENRKMAILDMEVWIGEGGNVLYQHYEKTVASKAVLHAQSAQSSACKHSVHAMELVRRILNTSPRLDWEQFVAPNLTNYMLRMKKAGYGQHYRKNTLKRALGIYDSMKEDEEKGERPLNRPRRWKKDERVMAKKKKVQNWSRKGGFIAPIFVPATPQGELAKLLRDMAETESEAGFKFKIAKVFAKILNPMKKCFTKSPPPLNLGFK